MGMKIFNEEIASSGKTRIVFSCGIEDIKIMAGLVEKAKMYIPHMPDNKEVEDLYHRLNSMWKVFSIYLIRKEKSPIRPKDTQCSFCERKLRGEKAIEMHVLKVHSKEAQK